MDHPVNEQIYSENVSWTLNEDAVKTLDVTLPTEYNSPGQQYLVSIQNNSNTVAVSVAIGNMILFKGAEETVFVPVVLIDEISVPAGGARGKIITGFPLGASGRLVFTKSTVNAPAFTVNVDIRRA